MHHSYHEREAFLNWIDEGFPMSAPVRRTTNPVKITAESDAEPRRGGPSTAMTTVRMPPSMPPVPVCDGLLFREWWRDDDPVTDRFRRAEKALRAARTDAR